MQPKLIAREWRIVAAVDDRVLVGSYRTYSGQVQRRARQRGRQRRQQQACLCVGSSVIDGALADPTHPSTRNHTHKPTTALGRTTRLIRCDEIRAVLIG